MAPIWFHLSLYSIIDSHVFLVNIPFNLIYMNSSILKMRSPDNKWIHLISLGYSSLIVICGFSHFDVVCPDVLNDTFSWTSVLLSNFWMSLPLATSPHHVAKHVPHIIPRNHHIKHQWQQWIHLMCHLCHP
jgi:hypothetical protein